MTVALYLLAAFGLAYIVGHSTISLPFRVWLGGVPAKPEVPLLPQPGALGPIGDWVATMLECPACFGFWIGLCSAIAGVAFPEWTVNRYLWPVVLGCITSGSNYIIGRLTRLV